MFLLLYVEDDTLVWSGDYDSITSATEKYLCDHTTDHDKIIGISNSFIISNHKMFASNTKSHKVFNACFWGYKNQNIV